MPLLFSYGTLRQERVQLALFGRTLVGHTDELLGFEEAFVCVEDPEFARTSGKAVHAILRPTDNPDATVSGTALEVTKEELEIADHYEPAEYHRVVAKLASGKPTWVYVAAASTMQRKGA